MTLLVLIFLSMTAQVMLPRELSSSTQYFCGFKDEDVEILGESQTPPLLVGLNGKPIPWRPIRIHLDTSNIQHLDEDHIKYLTDVVTAQAHKILQGVVQVRSEEWIDQDEEIIYKCTHRDLVKIPEIYRKKGVKADFIVFLAVTSSESKLNSIGKANPCYWQKDTKRPLAGFVVLDYDYFKPFKKPTEKSAIGSDRADQVTSKLGVNKVKQDVYNYLHELLHTLIFSKMLFKEFPDVDGESQMGECSREKSKNMLELYFKIY